MNGTLDILASVDLGPEQQRMQVLIDVRQITDAQGVYPEVPFEQSLMAQSGVRQALKVPPGRYRLEARIPGGRVIREKALVAEDETQELEFRVGGSGHEWLAWQAAMGQVQPAKQYNERLTRATAKHLLNDLPRVTPRIRSMPGLSPASRVKRQPVLPKTVRHARRPMVGPETATFGLESIAPIEFDIGLSEALEDFPVLDLPALTPFDGWADQSDSPAVVQLVDAEVSLQGLTVVGAQPPSAPAEQDALVALWKFTSPEATFPIAMDQVEAGACTRKVAIVTAPNDRFLAFLPLPWLSSDYQSCHVELLYDHGRSDGREVRLTVSDAIHAPLLAFLGERNMVEATSAFGAGHFVEQIHEDILKKRRNPLAAAAAAYVGLGFAVGDARRDSWSKWLGNLINWFPAVPDGAILYARDRLDRAQDEEDLKDALTALVKAYRRGPPYFAVGLRYLRDGLGLFKDKADEYGFTTEEISENYKVAAEFALLTDPSQAFTVVRLPEGDEHVQA